MANLASKLPVSMRSSFNVSSPATRRQVVWKSVDLIRNILFVLFLFRYTRLALLHLYGYGPVGTLITMYNAVRRESYRIFLNLPFIRTKVQADIDTAIVGIEKSLIASGPGVTSYTSLPRQGWTGDQIRAELDKMQEMKRTRWEDGRVSGAVYHGGKELCDLQTEAFGRFGVANPLHPDVFPAVRKMEAEIVAMVLGLFHAPEGAAGVTTSGGTESIVMAVLAAREKARRERGVTEPEIILPETAHTAFRKGAAYFKIKVHLVPCPGPSYKASISHISRLINRNTILLVGSAPNFPHGIIDDIASLSKLALSHKLPLHVDCCLGSFIVPFLTRAGFDAEPFDFALPGVTSISCDTHKYGFAPKGNSVVLYRSKALRKYQYFVDAEWSGGVYASPSIAGSRPGALIAGAWASLMSTGEEGYLDSCVKIVGAAKRIAEGIQTRDGLRHELRVVGKPLVSVVAFMAREGKNKGEGLDIYEVADGMSARGWHLNALQNPPAMHVAVTMPIVAAVDDLLTDLELVITEVRERERAESVAGVQRKKKGDAVALYGVAGALPDKTIIKELAVGFLDTLYKA